MSVGGGDGVAVPHGRLLVQVVHRLGGQAVSHGDGRLQGLLVGRLDGFDGGDQAGPRRCRRRFLPASHPGPGSVKQKEDVVLKFQSEYLQCTLFKETTYVFAYDNFIPLSLLSMTTDCSGISYQVLDNGLHTLSTTNGQHTHNCTILND